MTLKDDESLERSAVVANCRMNRERDLRGTNGYDRELGFDPLAFLGERQNAAWLDLCCGKGRALIQASRIARAEGLAVEIVGVDLVGMFDRPEVEGSPQLIESSLRTWSPSRPFDLITCIHGLHYVGDKLSLIARACSWLAPDGLLVASLDLANLKLPDPPAVMLRRIGLGYDARRRLLSCRGRRLVSFPYSYLGADDNAGPNHTGQAAVHSHYVGAAIADQVI